MKNDEFEGKIDAKGEFELYRSFWAKLKEVVSAPEVSRRLVEAVGKKRRLDWYSIRDYDLGVKREDELVTDFPRDGDIVLVIECENQTEGQTFIKFNSPNSDAFDLAKYRKLRHNFSNLYLTNAASPGHTLYLLLGRGDWDIERHHPEEEIMAINADTVDSIHASASREAEKLIALGSDGFFPDNCVRNIQHEIEAELPDSPVKGDIFIATDTGKLYYCYTDGTWTEVPSGADYVAKALFDANTILAANADNTPLALTIAEQRLVGRITGGNIAALTAAQIRTLINVENGAAADQVASEVSFTPAGNIVANEVQAAIEELDTEKLANIIEDTSPQLGGDLDAQNHSINNLLGIGAVPISAAQWAALGTYEEGTWTPLLEFGGASVGMVYGAHPGYYAKIGRMVTLTGYIRLTAKGTSTGIVSITGLPFTVLNNVGAFSIPSLRMNKITFANMIYGMANINSTMIYIYEVTEAGVETSLTEGDFVDDSEIMLTITYFIN